MLCAEDVFGLEPVKLKWNIVRGDTSTLRIDFFEEDEATHYNISNWEITATAYDPKAETFDDLIVTVNDGWIVITAESDITSFWGSGIKSRVNELSFDVEVILDDNTTWTPVRGFISVIGDVTGGSL